MPLRALLRNRGWVRPGTQAASVPDYTTYFDDLIMNTESSTRKLIPESVSPLSLVPWSFLVLVWWAMLICQNSLVVNATKVHGFPLRCDPILYEGRQLRFRISPIMRY